MPNQNCLEVNKTSLNDQDQIKLNHYYKIG